MDTAALQLDYVSSIDFSEKPALWWNGVLGVAGFALPPSLDAAPQVPVTASMTPALEAGTALCEVWRVAGPQGTGLSVGVLRQGRVAYRYSADFLFGSMLIDDTQDGLASGAALANATTSAYQDIFALLEATGHGHLVRVWNYLPDINGEVDGNERYQLFNAARQSAFVNFGRSTEGTVPAACALGSPAGSSMSIFFLASRQSPTMIENPRQTSAYHYPPKFGVRSPTFSRACVLNECAGVNLFVSGTASIVGHETIHPGDVVAQTLETVANIEALLGEANRVVGERYAIADLRLKVYVRRAADLMAIKSTLAGRFTPAVPIVYLLADVCRDDLLMEIEAIGATTRG